MKTLTASILSASLLFTTAQAPVFGMGFHGGGGGGGFGGGGRSFGGGGGNFGGGGGGFKGGFSGPSGGGSFGGYGGGSNFGGGNRPGGFGGANNQGGGNRPGSFGGSNFGSGNPGGGERPGNFGGGNFGGGNVDGRNRPGAFGDSGKPTNDQLQNFLGMGSPDKNNFGSGNFSGSQKAPWQTKSSGDFDNIRNNISDHNKLGTEGNGDHNQWLNDHPEVNDRINNWGGDVRNSWNDNHPNWNDHNHYGDNWWHSYHPEVNSWYYNSWHNHPWNYWWAGAAWGTVNGWMLGAAFSTPVYYSYGSGGNVVYQNDNVYVNGQQVGTAGEYAQSAADLAYVSPDQVPNSNSNGDSNQEDDWLPLGTFSLSTSESDTNPARTLQLAVNKSGIVSGTMYNSSTQQSWPVQGKVDKQTQRVAFTIGNQAGVVLETGIYNLTQPQTEVLVHYGTDQTQTDLLVRLDAPQSGASGNQGQSQNAPLPQADPGK
ncbi:hypothetical protein SH668x_002882 [Planctomicrobium sp. SH668]|uniref:hypothetical protein n=1 Tax=Planctomicrobium sp. SH668 TaxID=3448126 RepID=UPI003F5C23D1